MTLPTTVAQLFKIVDDLNLQGNDFLYFEYAYQLYIDSNKNPDFLKFLQEYSLDICEQDFTTIEKEFDYSGCKWINHPEFEFHVSYNDSYFTLHRQLAYGSGFANDLSQNIIYSVSCPFNEEGFYIENVKFPYNRKNLTFFFNSQICTNDKLFVNDYHVINLFNLLYCREISDKKWLSFLENSENLSAFFANSLSVMPFEDTDFSYYVYMFNSIARDKFKDITAKDFFINPSFFHKLPGFIYSYFFMSQLELSGITNICSRMFQNHNEARYALSESEVIHYYDRDIDLNFKDNKISVRLIKDSINSINNDKKTNMNLLIETEHGDDQPFRKIQDAVKIIVSDINNFYTQWDNEQEYKKKIEDFLRDHSGLNNFEENKHFINIKIIKDGAWCNPPDIEISTAGYLFSFNYEGYHSSILSHINELQSVLNKNVLKDKLTKKCKIKKNISRI